MGIRDWSNGEREWRRKRIEARGRGKREGGGGEGDCSEREEETKGIDARGRSVCTGDHMLMEPSFGLCLLQKGDHLLKEMNVRGIYVPLRLLRKLMVTTMELQIMVFRCETYGRLAAPRVWI